MKPALWIGMLLSMAIALPARAQEHLAHGRFKDVMVYRPANPARAFVLLVSAEPPPRARSADMANALAARGGLVAGIDLTQLLAAFDADDDACIAADGDLENLSHYIQGYMRLPAYYKPILVGDASAATFVRGVLAQAPAELFAGAIAAGSRGDIKPKRPLCDSGKIPKTELISFTTMDRARFFAAYDRLSATHTVLAPPAPVSLTGLPLVEVPAAADGGTTFAVMISGDGGWAGIDKEVAASLAARNIPVVGFDSLRYFWTARTPQGLANDLDRILRYYTLHWKKSRALLIGYSQGADVMPFAVNRLPKTSQALVAQTVLLNLGQNASFEFHLDNWLGGDRGSLPILPEAVKLSAASTLCVYGQEEDESLCPKIPPVNARALVLPGGHHFDGEYDRVVEAILSGLAKR